MTQVGERRIAPSAEILTASRRWLSAVRPALLNRFRAAYLTGSVLVEGFDPKRSRVNVLVIASDLSGDVMRALANAIPASRRRPQFDPLFLTERQAEKSLDVFPIEWLEIRERHLLIEGDPVVERFEVPLANLRLQCEHELRAKHLRLRQQFLASHAVPRALTATLAASASGFAALFRTLLRLRGETPPASSAQVVERLSDLLRLDAAALLVPHMTRQTGRPPEGNAGAAYLRFLGELDKLIENIDTLRVP